MLTPVFEVHQDSNFVFVNVRLPYVKVSSIELDVNGETLELYGKPYFLRLELPGAIIENGQEHSVYDVDSQQLKITLPKEVPGLHFEGLELLTKLLPARDVPVPAPRPLVQVMGDDPSEAEEGQEVLDFHQPECCVPSEAEQQVQISLAAPTYGFNQSFSSFFKAYSAEEASEVLDLPNPDSATVYDRRHGRCEQENNKFDPEHYIGDYFEDQPIVELLAFSPHWTTTLAAKLCGEAARLQFTEDENEALRRLPNKRYLLNDAAVTMLSLVDILYCYAYNERTSMGDPSCESAWTICKLSPTLSWFEEFHGIEYTVHSLLRRALCFPLYRNWDLATTVLKDVVAIMQCGRSMVLRCLLQVKKLLEHTEMKYILGILYINDYCVWVQHMSDAALSQCLEALCAVKPSQSLQFPYDLNELIQDAMDTGE